MKPPLLAVVDASVAVKLFVPEDHHELAIALFEAAAENSTSQISVPDMFFAECANVLWKWVRRGYPAADAIGDFGDLHRIGFHVVPTQTVAQLALDIALRSGASAYDACYAATAAHLNVPLVTADRKLIETLRRQPCKTIWLGDIR